MITVLYCTVLGGDHCTVLYYTRGDQFMGNYPSSIVLQGGKGDGGRAGKNFGIWSKRMFLVLVLLGLILVYISNVPVSSDLCSF